MFTPGQVALYSQTVAGGPTDKLNYWTGSAWVTGTLKYWDGGVWVAGELKTWNGTAWV